MDVLNIFKLFNFLIVMFLFFLNSFVLDLLVILIIIFFYNKSVEYKIKIFINIELVCWRSK